jgi:multidrug efflux pump subunit AcrA (membrane-fusion protein)/YHS domain-containing protein
MKKAIYAVVLILVVAAAYFAGRHEKVGVVAASGPRRVLYWVDPMHPAYKSDKPGIAPDCGMQLEPVYADGQGSDDSGAAGMPSGTVKLDSDRQQLAGVRVASAEKVSGTRSVRILGKVAADDRLVYRVVAGVEGWVRETFDASIGSRVKKDEKLATYYSPDFVAQINSYIVTSDRSAINIKETGRGVELAALRLRNLGMSEMQIKELGEAHQVPENVYAVSPADGFIIARNISPGLRFERGAEFYRIADLSHVWIMADVFENEARFYHPGMVATVTVPQLGKTLRARVSEVLPQFDPATRTMKVRLEAQNPGFMLRPDMFVDIELPVNLPSGVSVPVDALVDSGRAKRIFVDRGNGFFEPRQVETGVRFDDRVVITSGLKEGERVVVAGTFLVDSESRLKTVAAGMHDSTPDDHMPPAGKEYPPQAMATMKQAKMPVGETVDHKCGMKIDPAKSAAEGNTLDYHGTKYYFCSRLCKEEFAKRPEQYLAAGHQSGGQ